MYNRFGQPPVSKITRPYPAIVIAIGSSARRVARQVERIYLRGDARRAAAVAFYQLMQDETDGLALQDLANTEDAGTEPEPISNFLEERQAALRTAVEHGPALRSRLERALHDQRIHDKLITAGWGEKFDIPLNLFILGDVNDPWAAGALIPLGAVLNDLLETTGFCQAHWLFDIAIFPDAPQDQDLAVWSFLKSFDDFLRPESPERKKLVEALQFQSSQIPDFSVFLFDSRLEGTTLVKDQTSLETLMGNALLALLQENLAGQFFAKRDWDAMYDRGSYYGSLGATAIIYNPDALQVICAQRSGYAFLAEKILCPAQDGQAAIRLAGQILEKLGSIHSWLEKMCSVLPPAIGQVQIQTDFSTMIALLTSLDQPALDYERVRQTPWAAKLREYDDKFQKTTIPEINAQLVSNQKELSAFLTKILQTAFERLPLEPGLYPGGLENGRSVLELLTENSRKVSADIANLRARLPENLSVAVAKFASQCSTMEKLLSEAPELPWWARILPAFIRKWLAPIWMTWKYGEKIYLAKKLQEECVELLQLICGIRIVQQALAVLIKTPAHLQAQTRKTRAALKALESKMVKAENLFSPEWGDFPLDAAEDGGDVLFRRLVTEQELAEWSYKEWQPDLDSWVQDFLAARPLFENWRTVDMNGIAGWVQERAGQAYRPVWSISLDDIFALWEKEAPGFPDGKHLSQGIIRECMVAAIPPARPNFDAVGGSHGVAMTFHGVTGDPEWKYCCLPIEKSGTVHWEAAYSSEPYVALFAQAHHNFPLKALVDSFQNAWERFDSLPTNQRQAYTLLAGHEQKFAPIVETTAPNSPDLVHKTYQWKFTPKGSKNVFEQTIELAISRSRFEYYRRQPRLNGQWNVYAEMEMPEVRDLAAEFQKLHADHEWSTYDQACNVLKFVQSCIPYSYDKDATGHEDCPRYPIETLMEDTRDCEDVAILCAAVIARLGFRVVLLVYSQHLAFGVAGAENLKGDYVLDPNTGSRYFFGEATSDGWHLGETPANFHKIVPMQIIEVNILIQEDMD
jgi:hypothetical protein